MLLFVVEKLHLLIQRKSVHLFYGLFFAFLFFFSLHLKLIHKNMYSYTVEKSKKFSRFIFIFLVSNKFLFLAVSAQLQNMF